MSIFNFKTKTINKRYEEHCEEARSFIQVHYVRERGSDRYAFNTLTIKSDPEREKSGACSPRAYGRTVFKVV